jgi:hypothetical protein
MITLESLDLAPGDHVLTLRFEGADPDIEVPEIGMDFIGAQKVER